MSLIKLGELIEIKSSDIQNSSSVLSNFAIASRMADDSEILIHFKKVANELKKIAPKAKDFLYFSAIMMHAAEAALLDDNGELRKNANGKEVEARWEKNGESLKWICSDKNIKAYKNHNGDIFPEHSLLLAHKKWVGRPLCLDHKSNSVDMIRGVIVDTFYDHKNKRVIALCALDKLNYPDLAHKVATGYAASVSMGTVVGRAICYDCGQVARVEADFCQHMKDKTCYGEINEELNPIELSIVVNGADQKAKIRHIVASAESSLARYIEIKKNSHKMVDPAAIDTIIEQLQKLKTDAEQVIDIEEQEGEKMDDSPPPTHTETEQTKTSSNYTLNKIEAQLDKIQEDLNKLSKYDNEDRMATISKQSYFQGGGGVNEPTPGKTKYEKEDSDSIRARDDKQMNGAPPFPEVGPPSALYPGDDAKKKALQRMAELEASRTRRKESLARIKNSYFQGGGGVNEPTPGKPKYEKEDSDSIRAKDDKQMNGAPPFPNVGKVDGLYDGDLEKKKLLLRADVKANFTKVSNTDGTPDLNKTTWKLYSHANGSKELLMSTSAAEIMSAMPDCGFNLIATKDFGRKLLNTLKSEGFDKTVAMFKSAQVPEVPSPTPPAAPVGSPMGSSQDPMGSDLGQIGGDGATKDTGKTGDPKDEIPELIHKCQNHLSDLSMAFDALNNESSDEVSGIQDLAEQQPKSSLAKLYSIKGKIQNKLCKGLNKEIEALKYHLNELPMALAVASSDKLRKTANVNEVKAAKALVSDAVADARNTLSQSLNAMASVSNYARSVESLNKQALRKLATMKKLGQMTDLTGIGESSPQVEKSLQSMPGHQKRVNPVTGKSETLKGSKWFADGTNMYWDGKQYLSGGSAPAAKHPASTGGQAGVGHKTEGLGGEVDNGVMTNKGRGEALNAGNLKDRQPGAASGITTSNPAGLGTKTLQTVDTGKADDKDEDKDDSCDADDVTLTKADGTKMEMDKDTAKDVVKDASINLGTKEGRAAYRAKLAKEQGLAVQKELSIAHPGGGFTTKLDTKPSGDLAKVETLEEKQKVMLEIARAAPKVKKLAEQIDQYIKEGKLTEDRLPGLVSEGLDPDAVKYWRAFFGQAKDGGSQFAAELVKEHTAKKVAEDKEVLKVKFARAYDLANKMQARGMIGQGEAAISQQVNDTVNWEDKHFESVKKMVEAAPLAKQASSRMPMVGMLTDPPEVPEVNIGDLSDKLWGNRRY